MRILADLGNARLKLARLSDSGAVAERAVVETGRPDTWPAVLAALGGLAPDAEWAIASVRPEAAEMLADLLAQGTVVRIRWYRSAADVPVRHRLVHAGSAGADRALAVLGCGATHALAVGGVVVMCGTAITVERIEPGGIWSGGAIAPGWRPLTRALHDLAAQLPQVERIPEPPVPRYGLETRTALEAGLQGMLVGGCRELLGGIRAGLPAAAVTVWTGGDAPWLAEEVEGDLAQVEPDLVLRGLAVAQGWGT